MIVFLQRIVASRCGFTYQYEALQKLFSTEFAESVKQMVSPFGGGGVAVKVTAIIESVNLEGVIKKQFYDKL